MGEQTKKIGAIWEHGNFLSGEIDMPDGTKLKFVAFKNDYKHTDKHPDFVILKARDKQ